MNPDYRKRLEQYISTMIQAKSLLVSGNISTSDYAKIDTMISEKYDLSSCNIYRGMICTPKIGQPLIEIPQ